MQWLLYLPAIVSVALVGLTYVFLKVSAKRLHERQAANLASARASCAQHPTEAEPPTK